MESRDDPNTHKLLFELRARGHQGSVVKSKTDSWFSDAHSKIVQWFLGMTSTEIQRNHWKLTDVIT
ncbi:MAG: hypothetical protein OXG08_11765 [Gammaproteobacteria bacterium]|nr:hypothetical protein [Gammaproteobacteria bacterium]